MTNLDSILKSRDITLPTKIHLVKAMIFPVVMYGCEIWTVKKAECRKIYAFDLWCWRRLLRVPWTARRSNQSILKEINPGCSLEGLMLKLKLQYFGHLLWRADSLEKTLIQESVRQEKKGMTEDEIVGWHQWLDGHGFGWIPRVGDGQEAWCAEVHGVAKSQIRLSDWTKLMFTLPFVMMLNLHILYQVWLNFKNLVFYSTCQDICLCYVYNLFVLLF